MTTPSNAPAVEWARAFAVFDQAIAIDDPAERARVVSRACDGDDVLRDAVRRLLEADGITSPLLDAPAALHAAQLVGDDGTPGGNVSAVGRVVGPYRIVRELGRGGMGVVYLAERDDVSMRVALKLVRGGLAAPDHIERFLLERRVLARLEHPRIARLVDAGVSHDGTPWFAMEYVEGDPIDQFCDSRRLTIIERVALFERVCEGVQFAHSNLVVHRDLKPSNILIADGPGGAPGTAEPKLLDFGIAKLIEDDAEPMTGTATRLMTPDYAAPEQVRGTPVTTATDVYSLGVVLYQLLTGQPPYELRSASLADVARAVLDTRPGKPSTIELTTEVAAARHATVDRLRRQLVGDLDTIVGKALEKDPAMRYPSAEALLRDLRRHREGRAVSARPATMGYRVRTFVRRHKALVAATVALVALLAGFAASMTYQQAQTAQALHRAEAETEKARRVTGFLVSVFRDADPFQQTNVAGGPMGGATSLDAAARRIESELAGQPDIRGELLATLGVIQRNLGRYRESNELLHKAIDERHRTLGAAATRDRSLATYYHELGITLRYEAAYDTSRVMLERALAMRRALLPAADPEIAATLGELASVYRYVQAPADARGMLEEAARIQEAHGDSVDLAVTLDRLAVFAGEAGDMPGAESIVRRSLALRERALGPDHPLVAQALTRLAWVLVDADRGSARLDSAEAASTRALEIQRRRLGARHPSTLTTLSGLSLIIRRKGDLARAEELQREALDGRRSLLGPAHRDVAGALANLAATLEQRGDLVGADTLFSQSLATYQRLGGMDPDGWALMLNVASLKQRIGDETGAIKLAHDVAALPPDVVHGWDYSTTQQLIPLVTLLATHGDCTPARVLATRADSIRARLNAVQVGSSGVAALGQCGSRGQSR